MVQKVAVLTHADALAAIEAVRSELERDGRGAAVAVVDSHGELIALLRTDGCPLPSVTIAINKAYSAARQRVESSVIGAEAREAGHPLTNFGDPRITGWGGGVPIRVGDRVVGAVGVSGLPEEDDVALAHIGAKAVVDA